MTDLAVPLSGMGSTLLSFLAAGFEEVQQEEFPYNIFSWDLIKMLGGRKTLNYWRDDSSSGKEDDHREID